MSIPLWAIEAAEGFWQAAGEPGPFPRDLRRPIALSMPLALVCLPGLRVAAVDRWLRRVGIPCAMSVADRPLRACLVARRGQGLLFLDGADQADEARFSLAHELAHYLRHYRQPRRRAAERLGPEIMQVLDGDRAPHHSERVHALLAGVPIGYHIHLMDRGDDGGMDTPTCRAEDEADSLAYELLAPAESVLPRISRVPVQERRDLATFLLRTAYGLPNGPARRYSGRLAPPHRRSHSLLERLRAVP
jgi:hypothetical protein